jgi:4-diphosphocytidyl-2-C-methyl-D-erythritol kinase
MTRRRPLPHLPSDAAPKTAVAAFAAAKVNLYLHIVGRRPDGYHLVDSLVGFADIGDRLVALPAASLSLEIGGPVAAELGTASTENLVLRAARVLASEAGVASGAAIRLEKNLPVAAGLGGGSSDAAAALRALSALWHLPIGEAALCRLGLMLGADLPVCLQARPAWVGGIGDEVDAVPDLPAAGILLVNPRRRLSTAAVFAARRGPFGMPGRFSPMPRDAAALAQALSACRNDLAEAAIGLVPEISQVLAALAGLEGALLARMSGSGSSCFALFIDRPAAEMAGTRLTREQPQWWCAAGTLVTGSALAAVEQA